MRSLQESYKKLYKGEIEDIAAKKGAMEDLIFEEYKKKNPGAKKAAALGAYYNRPGTAHNPSTPGKRVDSWTSGGGTGGRDNRQTAIGVNKYWAGKAL